MKTFQARVYVRHGNGRLPHTVQIQAQTSFAAQQMLVAQYGASNIISVPTEIRPGGTGYNPAPWMKNIG